MVRMMPVCIIIMQLAQACRSSRIALVDQAQNLSRTFYHPTPLPMIVALWCVGSLPDCLSCIKSGAEVAAPCVASALALAPFDSTPPTRMAAWRCDGAIGGLQHAPSFADTAASVCVVRVPNARNAHARAFAGYHAQIMHA